MKILFIILLFGCTATKPKLSGRSDVSVPVYTNEQLTAFHIQDSLEIVELKKNIVYLPKSQWIIDSTGAAIMRGTDSLTVNYLMVQAPKIDTTNHGGLDSIPIIPVDSTAGKNNITLDYEGDGFWYSTRGDMTVDFSKTVNPFHKVKSFKRKKKKQ